MIKVPLVRTAGSLVVITALGKPPFKKSAGFFNIGQKAFDPPPLI